jgi:hypothetical protein
MISVLLSRARLHWTLAIRLVRNQNIENRIDRSFLLTVSLIQDCFYFIGIQATCNPN